MRQLPKNRSDVVRAERRFRVLHRDGFRCVYCGKSALDGACLSVAFHEDHLFPKSIVDSSEDEDLVTACSDCNIGKGDTVLERLPPSIPDPIAEQFHLRRHDLANVQRQQADIRSQVRAWDRELCEVMLSFDPRQRASFCRQLLPRVRFESDACRKLFVSACDLDQQGVVPSDCELEQRVAGTQAHAFLLFFVAQIRKYPVDMEDRLCRLEQAIQRRDAEEKAHEAARRLKNMRLPAEEGARLIERLVFERRVAQGAIEREEATDGSAG